MQHNQEKPLSKSSNRLENLSESRGRWDHGRAPSGEWTCEGRAKAFWQVAADGSRTRYQRGGGWLSSETSGRFARQLGWYRRMKVLSQKKIGTGLFLLPGKDESDETIRETMAKGRKFLLPLLRPDEIGAM